MLKISNAQASKLMALMIANNNFQCRKFIRPAPARGPITGASKTMDVSAAIMRIDSFSSKASWMET